MPSLSASRGEHSPEKSANAARCRVNFFLSSRRYPATQLIQNARDRDDTHHIDTYELMVCNLLSFHFQWSEPRSRGRLIEVTRILLTVRWCSLAQ